METPLDDYRFEPNFWEKKIKRELLALLPQGEELLWMGQMKRGSSYWYSKGLFAMGVAIGSLLLSSFLLFQGYLGFIEGEFAGKYPRVFAAIGAALLPWIAGYFLAFQRLIYDSQTRYAFSSTQLVLYLPAQKKQPYQSQALLELGELEYRSHADKTGTIFYDIEVPDSESGGIGLLLLPLLEFIEDGPTVFRQLVNLQEGLIEQENAALDEIDPTAPTATD